MFGERIPGASFAILLPILLVALSAPARAGVDNSHHDIRDYLPEKDACLVCHDRTDTNYYGVMEEELGRVGGQCVFLCHSGKGILPETEHLVPKAGPSVDTATYAVLQKPDYRAVYFTRGHGRYPGNLRGRDGQAVPWPPPGVSWQGLEAGSPIECTSCHAVHDGTYAPFLLAPMYSTPGEYDGFCDRCHPERATSNLTGPPDGNHPVDFFLDPAAAAKRSGRGRHPRKISLQRYGDPSGDGQAAVFDVPSPAAADLTDKDVHWEMGGHLADGPRSAMRGWQGSAGGQQVGCYTCHSAHRPNTLGERNQVVVRTVDPSNGWSPLCVGCHGNARAVEADMDEWNPGGTPWGHPAGRKTRQNDDGSYTVSTGAFRIRITVPTYLYRQGGSQFGPQGELLCTTCHTVHFGMSGSLASANLGQGTGSICKSCHNGLGNPPPPSGTPVPPNSHHVTWKASEWGRLSNQGFQNPSWVNTVTGMGDLSTGLDCPDCHIANNTAHNWN
jgi:hypothetical protein